MTKMDESFLKALERHRAGALDEAERMYREILRVDPSHGDALHLLGVIEHQSQRSADAIQHIGQAIKLKPHSAICHNNLAAAHRALGRNEIAAELYRRAIALKPDYADALRNLGSLLLEQRSIDEAADCYLQAVGIDSNDADSWFRLGNISNDLGRPDVARECFRRATEIQPAHAEAHFNLANALRADGDRHGAVIHYRRAIQAVPNFMWARLNLAATFFELGEECERENQPQKASLCYQQALKFRPSHASALVSLGNIFKCQDEMPSAAACYRRLMRDNRQPAALELWLASLCPAVFETSDAIDAYRSGLANQLGVMDENGFRLDRDEVQSLGSPVPYNLQFHGRDDQPLKAAFANLIDRSVRSAPAARNAGAPRVGYVVTAGHEGAFLRFLRHAIVGMRRAPFDRVIICQTTSAASLRQSIADDAVQFLEIPDRLEAASAVIRAGQFDVLYYWEVGSDVLNYFLPFHRLAPVQCTSCGLPVTTGISAMDYFLSYGFAEPNDAANHYSERLILANSQLSCQRRMRSPDRPKSRPEFGLSDANHLYVCAQKIEKFHPEFDALMAEILRRDQLGRIVIPRDKGGYRARKLQRRIASTFPDVIDRFTFLPRLEIDDYLSLLNVADVVLDPLHYGGGLTAWDAFSLNKPVVTMPTRFVRGRYVFGFYRKMGIADCIAKSPDEYISIAVTLGTDSEKRRHVVERITGASGVLFDDESSIRDYSAIFDRMIDEARTS